MALREQTYSLEAFREISALPENSEKRLEWEDGVILDMGSSTRLNTVTAMRIGYFLNAHVIPNNLGFVTGADGGFHLKSARRVRRPDAAFVSSAHGIKLEGVEFDIAPDLAVELVSPNEDVFKKATEYLHSGTKIVWAVYAEERIIYVMTLNEQGAIVSLPFTENETLDGGTVLPGFSLSVRDIFPA